MAAKLQDMTPKQIVAELDKYIIGQEEAKKMVAIALRNRYRRSLLSEEMREEITPKNILMMGPTGCGKTEIARRLARLMDALAADGSGIRPSVPFDLVPAEGRLAGIVSVLSPGVDSETLVLECDQAGFEVSAASACSSGSLDASHVLLAMGIPRDEALCSLRISFDERVAPSDLDLFAESLRDIVARRSRRH